MNNVGTSFILIYIMKTPDKRPSWGIWDEITVFEEFGIADMFLKFISLDAWLSVKGVGIFKGETSSDRDAIR